MGSEGAEEVVTEGAEEALGAEVALGVVAVAALEIAVAEEGAEEGSSHQAVGAEAPPGAEAGAAEEVSKAERRSLWSLIDMREFLFVEEKKMLWSQRTWCPGSRSMVRRESL